jgi:DNA polymerase-3 subunit epsilon
MQLGLFDMPLVFIDVETTGLSPWKGDRVIEIGALRMEEGKIVQKINTLIYPECDVPYIITRITGIADEHVTGAPLFKDIWQEFEAITENAVFVAHNVNFDYGFIQSEYQRLGKSFKRHKLCTVQLSKALFPHESSHKLEHLIQRHKYEVKARHRAYDDAEVLYRFVTDMQKQHEHTNLTLQQLVS